MISTILSVQGFSIQRLQQYVAAHAVQIKQGAPISDEIIKTFVEDKYFRFLSKPRDAASWDRLEAIVRENASGSAAEVNELEQCGITVCSLSLHLHRLQCPLSCCNCWCELVPTLSACCLELQFLAQVSVAGIFSMRLCRAIQLFHSPPASFLMLTPAHCKQAHVRVCAQFYI